MSKAKYYVAVLTALTGGFFIYGPSEKQVQATAIKEGFTPRPVIPVPGDVPTIGHGTTVYANGVRVKMTDPPISRKQAHEYLKEHMNKDAVRFNKSLQGVKLSQAEYDLYFDFTYQFGTGAWVGSSMLRNLKAGQYVKACDSLLKWKYVAKRDCSVRKNNCYGVWTRQLERHAKCMGVN